MAEEDTKSLVVPGNADLGGSSSGNINGNGKMSFSDNECDNDACRETFSSVNSNVEHIRRYSTGKPSSPTITPRYLLASTGSCHDNCKSGLKPDIEEKQKRPWIKRSALSSSGKQNGVVTVAPVELKKSPLARSASFPVNLSHLLQHEASSDAISSPRPHKIIKEKILQPHKMIEVSLNQDPSSDRRRPKKGKGITDDSGEQSPSVMRQTTSRDSSESGHKTHKAKKKLNHSSEKISPPLHSQRVKAKVSRSLQAAGIIKEITAISKETLKNSKIASKIPYSIQTSRGANGINKRRDDEKISKANTKSSSLLTERTVVERGLKRDDVLTKKNKAASSSSAKKTLVSPGSSLSSRPSTGRKTAMKPRNGGSSKPVSSVTDQNKKLQKNIRNTSDEHVPEKTLHVVAIETKAKLSDSTEVGDIIPPLPELNLSLDLPCLLSHEEVGGGGREVVVDENDGCREDEVKREAEEKEEGEEEEHTSEDEVEQQGDEKGQQQLEDEEMEMDEEEDYDDDEEEEEEEVEEENEYESDEGDESIIGNKIVNCDGLSDIKGNICKPLEMGDTISESGDYMQVKLKFREGKILDIDSENKAPRRLRFRCGRIVEENGINNETRRRNFNKRRNSKANSNSTKDQKIVLRHQDLEEKKDDQGLLLNNVIEETASKLVESRKSKVKALVGAFETVISRHDSKPARR